MAEPSFRSLPPALTRSLHSFAGTDGLTPLGALVEDGQGTFYGTTNAGGANNLGTVFKFHPVLYTLTAAVNGSGAVTSTDGFINCPGSCAHSYLDNTPVTLNATPASGWAFSGWGGACSGKSHLQPHHHPEPPTSRPPSISCR